MSLAGLEAMHHHAYYVVENTSYHNDRAISANPDQHTLIWSALYLQGPRAAAINVGFVQDAIAWAGAEPPPSSDPKLKA